jgi:hypothetical protein
MAVCAALRYCGIKDGNLNGDHAPARDYHAALHNLPHHATDADACGASAAA